MALVKEDGTGLANANSYQDVADFQAYWTEVGYTISADAAHIEYALILATRYIETRFRQLWYGYRATDTQSLSWPRLCVENPDVPGLFLDGVVPTQVANATNEYARRALSGVDALMPDPADTDATGQVVKRVSKGIGPLRKDIEYSSAGAILLKEYPAADMWLDNLLTSSGGCIRA